MTGLDSPWWLFALAAIPLIRWLHRWRAPFSAVAVSAVFLWKRADSSHAAGAERGEPDPAWRWRALLWALIVLALARPWFQQQDVPVTVWVDHTMSMATSDTGSSRLSVGLEQLEDALRDAGHPPATLRSLSDPSRAIEATDAAAFDATAWPYSRDGPGRLPTAATLDPATEHWLLTDGANARLVEWSARAPLNRVIRVGEVTENLAITRVAARRNLEDLSLVDVLVVVSNRGTLPAQRAVILETSGQTMTSPVLDLAPRTDELVAMTLPRTARSINASLSNSDRLDLDDAMQLDLASLRKIAVAVDGACPAGLKRAVRSHGGLTTESGDVIELHINCGGAERPGVPMLRVLVQLATPVDADPVWLPAAGKLQRLTLNADWLAASGTPASGQDDVLLAAGERPLITRTGQTVDVYVDLGNPLLVDRPEFPAMIAGMIDVALGRDVLDPVAVSRLDAVEADVAPLPEPAYAGRSVSQARHRTGLAETLLLIAMALLAIDAALIMRARRRRVRDA